MMEMYVRMHPSYFVPIVTFHLPWGACCTGWNDEESRNGGKSAQADDRDDKGHQTLVGVVCKRQGDEMQQKWVEKLNWAGKPLYLLECRVNARRDVS